MKPFDIDGTFLPSIPGGGDKLRHVAVRSAGVTVLSGGFTVAIQMLATVVLARLLTPRDFGLVAMATTFSLLFVNVGLNGITEAVIQQKRIDRTLASNLFWINLGIGLLLTLGFAAAGSLIARFYGEPLVAPIVIGISATIAFTSASVLHLALLKRAMLFTAVAKNDLVAKGISVAVSIVLGWMGWGYWALVVGACTLPLSTAVGAWILCQWIPSRPRYSSETGSMALFALHTYGRFSINYVTRNTDNLLVGWRFGPQSLGMYKKAYDLFALASSQIATSTTVVAVAALSRVREDRDLYCRYLVGALAVMAFLGMGLSGVLTLTGRDVIRLILGPKWAPAGYLFTFFGPGIGAQFLYCTQGWIHLSIGRADRWFRWSILELLVTYLLFLLGLHWGVRGIAVAWGLSFWILTVPALSYAARPMGLKVTPMLAAVWKFIAASLLAGLICVFSASRLGVMAVASSASGAALRIALLSLSFVCLYLLAIILLGGYSTLRNMFKLLREMLTKVKVEQIGATRTPEGEDILTDIPQFHVHSDAE